MIDHKRKYWDGVGEDYEIQWSNLAWQQMSDREMEFVKKYLNKYKPKKLLDFGIGTGRIIDYLINNSSKNASIAGFDVSEKMVYFCRDKFRKVRKVKKLAVCDISKEKIDSDKVDFITAIRMLKYNKNWYLIVKDIYNTLNHNGIAIITMPNNNSINRFVHHTIPVYRSTAQELRNVCKAVGFEVLEIRSVSKIPDVFYGNKFKNNKLYVKVLIVMERLLEFILGKVILGRCLFVAARKK